MAPVSYIPELHGSRLASMEQMVDVMLTTWEEYVFPTLVVEGNPVRDRTVGGHPVGGPIVRVTRAEYERWAAAEQAWEDRTVEMYNQLLASVTR